MECVSFPVSKPRIDSYKEGAYQAFIDTELTDAIHHFAKRTVSVRIVYYSVYILFYYTT